MIDHREPGDVRSAGNRHDRQAVRRREITEHVMAEGVVRIEALAERFDVSIMTVHRDLDELEQQGLLRKSRGAATALSTPIIESSDVFRGSRQLGEKEAIALTALDYIEPGQAIILDDSTTVLQMVPHLHAMRPLTVITNTLTIMNQLHGSTGVSLIGVGGQYYNWCSSFMGHTTTSTFATLRADVALMSTAAITDDVIFHQVQETVDVKRAMFESAETRILLADHTKFERRALHGLWKLSDFDIVIVDAATPAADLSRMRVGGVNVVVAKSPRARALND